MRWLKHLSLAHADEAVSYILEEYGAEGYGIWWLILEDIAAPMETGKMHPVASHSAVKWAQICHCSVRRFRSIAIRLAEKKLIQFESDMDRIRIEVPNVLKYRDEYSKKSGESPEQDREQRESKEKAEGENPFAPSAQPKSSRLHMTEPTTEMQNFALDEMHWSVERLAEVWVQFADYWKAKPGKDGCKLDWVATWRNWCRNQRPPPKLNGSLFPVKKSFVESVESVLKERHRNGEKLL